MLIIGFVKMKNLLFRKIELGIPDYEPHAFPLLHPLSEMNYFAVYEFPK